MPIKQVIGLLGSILLILGAFSPIVKIPFVGQLNYINNGHGDGVIVLVLGIISILLVLFKKYNPLALTGIVSFGMISFTYFNIQNLLKESKSHLMRDLSGNPFKGLAEGLMNSVQIEWGFAIVIIGAILVLITPMIKDVSNESSMPPNNEKELGPSGKPEGR